ncbi:TonB-dependent receptor [Ichthyenterobacterium sp. W332]|uniref:TonB-dependent receptor n=1 Tax=Microcosmobacter mediterraneus TaxID=3075607 RepID=A0ABU2YHN0_9FLAO|nr:TonB-dependent receptor [Ichthyenterobacterium sp. W332]MDT0557676.1 TonB-dependent receptor [Ichthyenterobacterium sp. W332]
MHNRTRVLIAIFSIATTLGFAQTKPNDSLNIQQLDEVVVTDSKFKLKRENSGKVITKISQKDMLQRKGQSIAEIIATTAGIEINGARSNAGQNLSYLVRGGRNRQVVILIDGVQVTDPSQIANDYDLRLLNSDQVESIEILKGASSTLYGSGAATAIINIKLKEAAKDKVAISVNSALGTNQAENESDYRLEDFRNSVAISGTVDKFSFRANFGQQFTDGLSAISSGIESDAFNSVNGKLQLGYQFCDNFKLGVYASFDNFDADFDDSFGMADADNVSETDQYRIGLNSEFKYTGGSIVLNAAYNDVERKISSSFPSRFNAQSFIIDAYNKYNFDNKFYTIVGVNAQNNRMESFSIQFGSNNFSQDINPDDANFTIIDPYANVVYTSDFGLSVNAGVRLNNHSEYGSHFVYSLNPSYKKDFDFGYLKGLASYSTAFITPSLFQLFEPSFGNADLEPEENATIELGAEIGINNKGIFSLVYFNRDEENFVDFVDTGNFVFQYQNSQKSFTANGFEFTGQYKFSKSFTVNANATYTKVEDNLNLRIPELKVNTRLDYQLCDATLLSLSYQFNDERNDSFFNNSTFMSETLVLESFNILDLYISHKLCNNMTLFANISNLLNEDYQELFGFTTRGRNVTLGFNLNL